MSTKNSPKRIQLSSIDQVAMIFLCVFQFFLSNYFKLEQFHYLTYPLPSVFSAPSLVQSPYTTPSYFYNGLLYSLFFVQHIVMALVIFKVKASKLWRKFPLYERYIYNLASAVAYILIFNYAHPVSSPSNSLFTIPIWVSLPAWLIAFSLQWIAISRFTWIIFWPFSFKQILQNKSIEIEDYTANHQIELISTGLYGYCRHPMQGWMMIRYLFASNVYTVDRVIFLIVNFIGIYIGVTYEESKSIKRIKGYKEYKQKVPYKLIPYIF